MNIYINLCGHWLTDNKLIVANTDGPAGRRRGYASGNAIRKKCCIEDAERDIIGGDYSTAVLASGVVDESGTLNAGNATSSSVQRPS